MMKNYFTDEQVKEALEKLGMRRPFSSHSFQHYKNLMNLAVEAAIGSADVLVEALREITYSHDGYARKKAEQALATYDKLSKVSDDL